jgi:hypothetical protein
MECFLELERIKRRDEMSFEIDPITYRLEVKEREGFTPFRDEWGNWVWQRDIVLTPARWNEGSYIKFQIIEKFSLNVALAIPGLPLQHTREVCSVIFYDKKYPHLKELMDNLASNDLRGQVAKDTAWKLYWSLFSRSNELAEHLPELAKYYFEEDKVQV